MRLGKVYRMNHGFDATSLDYLLVTSTVEIFILFDDLPVSETEMVH